MKGEWNETWKQTMVQENDNLSLIKVNVLENSFVLVDL